MAFEFGMFHEFQRTAGMSQEEAFAISFEQVDAAERWGLDAMWLAEIHVAPERSVCSAPLTLASAIAARTKRMKIGTGVQVLPLCHPLRLAEEAATVDQISHGRLIFGVGRSGFPRTYEAYGVPYGESRERFAETLRNPEAGLDRAALLLPGQILQLRQRRATPKPYQKPWPGDPHRRQQRRHLPGRSPSSATACSSRCGSAPWRNWSRTSPPTAKRGRRRAILARARCSCALRSMSPKPTRRRATSPKRASCISTAISASGWRTRRPAPACGRSKTARRAAGGCRTISYDDALREKIIVGSPGQVTDRLIGLKEKLGLDGILCEMNCGTKIPHERVMKSLQLLCNEVMPRFN